MFIITCWLVTNSLFLSTNIYTFCSASFQWVCLYIVNFLSLICVDLFVLFILPFHKYLQLLIFTFYIHNVEPSHILNVYLTLIIVLWINLAKKNT
jgi:hypothetical protein